MFNLYGSQFNLMQSSEVYNGGVINCIYFTSKPISVSTHNIAISLPAKIRNKYFICDPLDQRRKINPDLYVIERKYADLN